MGDTLSAVLKPSSATVSYSWRVGGIEVSTEATYTVQQSDIGKLIQLKVNGIDSFSGVAICSASGEVRSSTEVFSVDLSIKNLSLIHIYRRDRSGRHHPLRAARAIAGHAQPQEADVYKRQL